MMRCLLVVLAVLLGAVAPAWAQTTIVAADCSANTTVSNGGLTVTINANASNGCRATTAKYGGQWYYELTFGTTTTLSFGFANNGTSQPVPGGWALNAQVGGNTNSGGWVCSTAGNGRIWWLNTSAGTGAACTPGKTAGVALDLDPGPEQIWITPDVTSLICDGNGNAGATDPQWNGSCVNDPSIPGTGGPVTFGTKGIWFPGYAYYPTVQAATNGNSATFNFGATSFVGTVPSGFSSWNTVGGAAPIPGPLNPQTQNVANAPKWQASHSYSLGDRVVAGPALSGGSYTNGQNLYLWAVKVVGTSAGSGNGPQTCGTPANYGGGLAGNIPSQWTGKTTATDGGVTWVCITPVDYATLTGAFADSADAWTTGTTYFKGQYVVNAGFSYKLENTPSGFTCTSGGSAPVGAVFGTGYSDGVCTWTNNGAITYSSGTSIIPHQHQNPQNIGEQQFIWNVFTNVWYGGQQQKVYQPGQNGETLPILMKDHYDLSNGDSTPTCYKGRFAPPVTYNCNNLLPYWFTLSAAPGDSFPENVNSLTQPLRVDTSKGVTFFSNSPKSAGNGIYLTAGESFGYSDGNVDVYRIQHQSTQGPCIAAHGYGPGGQHTNVINLHNSIFDCAGDTHAPGAILLDSGVFLDSDIVIWRSTLAATGAFIIGYPGPIVNSTFVCNPSATNSAAIMNQNQGAGFFSTGNPAFFPPPYKNNVMIGCSIGWAYGTAWSSTNGANNATDQASGVSGTYTAVFGGTWTKSDMPGVGNTCGVGNTSACFSLVPSQIFVNPTIGASLDLRLLSALSPIYGAGANNSFSTGGRIWGTIAPNPLDVYNNARPTGSRFDLGGTQFQGPAPGNGGGRLTGRL